MGPAGGAAARRALPIRISATAYPEYCASTWVVREIPRPDAASGLGLGMTRPCRNAVCHSEESLGFARDDEESPHEPAFRFLALMQYPAYVGVAVSRDGVSTGVSVFSSTMSGALVRAEGGRPCRIAS